MLHGLFTFVASALALSLDESSKKKVAVNPWTVSEVAFAGRTVDLHVTSHRGRPVRFAPVVAVFRSTAVRMQ